MTMLLHVKIFGFDPGERNISSLDRDSPPGHELEFRSVTENDTVPTPISQMTARSADTTHNGTHGHDGQTTLPEDNMETSFRTSSSEVTTRATSATQEDARSLETSIAKQFIKVDKSGQISFSHDRSFRISMSECSTAAYFESYSVLGTCHYLHRMTSQLLMPTDVLTSQMMSITTSAALRLYSTQMTGSL